MRPFTPQPLPTPDRRRQLRALLAMPAVALATPARAGFNIWESEYTLGRDELQALVAQRFPVRQRYANVFSVALRDPKLALDAQRNRAAITAALSIASPLLQAGTVDGIVAVSSALRYDAPARTLRLHEPKAERLELRGVTGDNAERLRQIGAVVAQELLRDQPLRMFTVEELTFGRKTWEIGDITVRKDVIAVQLR